MQRQAKNYEEERTSEPAYPEKVGRKVKRESEIERNRGGEGGRERERTKRVKRDGGMKKVWLTGIERRDEERGRFMAGCSQGCSRGGLSTATTHEIIR